MLWNPDTTSPYSEAVTLLIECLKAGMKTICFTKARKITELISLWVTQARPEWASQIKSYRAGYLPEERREIEAMLFKDELKAVISTSALEVGIDVGGLDACVLVGYPGTMISTWQRSGRVGRGEAPSVVFLVAMADAMDQYWMKHPTKFFTMKPESLMVGFGEREYRQGPSALRGLGSSPDVGRQIFLRQTAGRTPASHGEGRGSVGVGGGKQMAGDG